MDYPAKEAAAQIIQTIRLGAPIEKYQIQDLVDRLGGEVSRLEQLTPDGKLLYLVSLIIVNS